MTSTAPDLFTLVRRTDPSTSREAAARIAPKLSEIQAEVLQTLRQYPRGLCDWEMEEIMKNQRHVSTLRSRRAELVAKGLVIDSGERRLIRGSKRTVWRAV